MPEQNLAQSLPLGNRGHVRFDVTQLGPSLAGRHNALVQLQALPTAHDLQRLEAQGVTLGDYVGGYAYYALIQADASFAKLRHAGLTSLIPVRPEWKLCEALQSGIPPDYARVGSEGAKVAIRYAPNAPPKLVEEVLVNMGGRDLHIAETFRVIYAVVQTDRLGELAGLPWVLSIDVQQPLAEPTNSTGRILGRAEVLALPAVLGGRGLRGEGVRIGIWDSNIASHIDYGNRVHVQEYEESGDYGPHVLGTVLGAGMLDPDGKGMAPMAEAWSYNFNVQSNRLTSPEEMDIARRNFGISLSQNSYGVGLRLQCAKIKTFPYRASDINLDILSNLYPTLTHVFAAGNDQEGCAAETTEIWGKAGYGTISNHAKNVIHVGAVTATGRGTAFSSQGPHDDGRLAPTICARGRRSTALCRAMGIRP